VVPQYKLTEVEVREGEVSVTVKNAGTGRMPVTVAVERGTRFPDEDEELDEDERFRDARAEVVLGAGESATLTLSCDFDPERVVVDPDLLVLQLQRKFAIRRF
jgi:hypothetical protein